MHSHLSLRRKATPALLACALGLFSGSVIAAENWQALPPTKIGAAITDQIESHPDLTYARYGERALQLDLFRPKNADKPLPAIVCIHGGGWQSGNRLNHGHLAKALAARGFVAVSISYRLSGEATFPAQIHDAKAAVRWLRANAKQWGIDPDAIGATGLSAGGHLAALLATSGGVAELEGEGGNANFSSAIQSAAPMGAQSDFMSERNRVISKTADIWQQFLGGSQEDVPGVYRLASPRSHLDPKDPPTLFISGELDDASTHADEMRRDCMAFGIPSGLLVIPGAPHPFLTKQAFFDIAIDRIDSFFTLHLKQNGVPKVTTREAAYVAQVQSSTAQNTEARPIPGPNDRIGWSADGNKNDPDDFAATAIALAIFAKQGWQDKLVHIDYNNWLAGNTPVKTAEHKDGVLDASDGGMAFVLATGDQDGNFNPKLRDFLGTDWNAAGDSKAP